MKPLPDTKRIGAYSIKRVYRKKLGNPDNHGFFDSTKQLIEVRSDLTKDRERVVRCHEMLHAMAWDADLNLPDELEERVVTALSERLCATYPDVDF